MLVHAACFLAAEAGADLVTVTLQWSTPGSQDHHYAKQAADCLPGIESLAFPSAELPAFFTGLDERRDPLEGPSSVLRSRARRQYLARVLRARGPHGACRATEATTLSYRPPPTSTPCYAEARGPRCGKRPGSRRTATGR